MSKELEALEIIKNAPTIYVGCASDIYTRYSHECKIIETALKDYELMKQTKIIIADKKISDNDLDKLKNQRMFVGNLEQCEVKQLFDKENQKKLKALEIIKRKRVNVRAFLKCCHTIDGLLIYNGQCDNSNAVESKELSQKEYDLLKEVLK